MAIQSTLELVSVEPEGNALRLTLQNAAGEHVSVLITDPVEMQTIQIDWDAYKAAVNNAIANNTPWPAGPRYIVGLVLV